MDSSGRLRKLFPLEVIFSCGICLETVTDLYAKPESNHYFQHGGNSIQGIVAKLWFTQCGHLVCTEHLPGGGESFANGRLPAWDLRPEAMPALRREVILDCCS